MKIIMNKSKMVFKKESYTELSWIIPTSNTQVFRSPVDFPKDGKVELNIVMLSGGGRGALFGYLDYTANNVIRADREIVSSNTRLYAYLNSKTNNIYSSNFAVDTPQKIAMTRTALYINNTSVAIPSVTSGYDNMVKFGMVGLVNKKTSTPTYENSVATNIKFGGFKMWANASDDSSLIVDAIPVLRGNGDVCYYDKVSETFIKSGDDTNPNYEI